MGLKCPACWAHYFSWDGNVRQEYVPTIIRLYRPLGLIQFHGNKSDEPGREIPIVHPTAEKFETIALGNYKFEVPAGTRVNGRVLECNSGSIPVHESFLEAVRRQRRMKRLRPHTTNAASWSAVTWRTRSCRTTVNKSPRLCLASTQKLANWSGRPTCGLVLTSEFRALGVGAVNPSSCRRTAAPSRSLASAEATSKRSRLPLANRSFVSIAALWDVTGGDLSKRRKAEKRSKIHADAADARASIRE